MRREERSIGDRGIGSLMHIMVTIGEKSNRMRVNDSGLSLGGLGVDVEGVDFDHVSNLAFRFLLRVWVHYFHSRTSRF